MTTASTELSRLWSSLSPDLQVTMFGGGVRSTDSEMSCRGSLPEARAPKPVRSRSSSMHFDVFLIA